jgi:membrane protein YdbS with pleckstrin-like domain
MTAKTSTETTDGTSLSRIAGNMMIAVGALGVVLTLVHKAFVAPLPPVVIYANVTACVLEALLGVGVIQRRRAAWSFGVAIWGTFLVVNLLSLPQMIRAGFPVGGLSAIIASGRVLWGIVLLLASPEFRKRR